MDKKSLLLVDDEISILRSYARDLQEENYTVTTASDGEQAIQALRAGPFNIVITDLVMPGTGGMHVLREAKSRYPEICVVVLTGYGDMSSAVEALRLDADDYLIKPLDTDELLIRLAQLLKKQEKRHPLTAHLNNLTVCSHCNQVRSDKNRSGLREWMHWQSYLTHKTGVRLKHSCCPDCTENLRPKSNLL